MDFFNPRQVPEDGYQISYESPAGDWYELHNYDRALNRERRVALVKGGWSGGESSPDFAEQASVTNFGVHRTGFKIPSFEGSLDVVVRDVPSQLAFTRRNWVRSWSYFQPGKLRVVARDGGNKWTPVVLRSLSEPEFETASRNAVQMQVGWESLAGTWLGAPAYYVPGESSTAVRVVTPGDVKPSVRLIWDSSKSAKVTFPSGQVLTLNAGGNPPPPEAPKGLLGWIKWMLGIREKAASYTPISGARFINLDRGMAGQITRPDGSVDSQTWSQLRGQVLGVSLEPHEVSHWVLEGAVGLEVTPRYLTPWG